MKKENILKKNLEFQKIINKKKQTINKYLIIFNCLNESYLMNRVFHSVKSDHFEIGISIPKKFINAVKRNFIKRQIKWILDSYVEYKNIKYKLVLIVRKEYLSLTIDEKKEQIIKMFQKFK